MKTGGKRKTWSDGTLIINKAPKNNRKNTNANRAVEKRAHAPSSLGLYTCR